REVAVVGHVEAMGSRPHEGADDGLREEEAIRVTCLDAGDPDTGRDPHDADSVGRCRDCAGGVGAVTVVVCGGDCSRNRATGQTVDAVGRVNVGCQVGMRVVETRVNVTDKHAGAATGDRMRVEYTDLAHVPLPPAQVVPTGGRSTGYSGGADRVETFVAESRREPRRRGGALHTRRAANV